MHIGLLGPVDKFFRDHLLRKLERDRQGTKEAPQMSHRLVSIRSRAEPESKQVGREEGTQHFHCSIVHLEVAQNGVAVRLWREVNGTRGIGSQKAMDTLHILG